MAVFVRLLNAFLMVAMPLALGAILSRRLRLEWRLFAMGCASFVASQLLHLPFNAWVLSPALVKLGYPASGQAWQLVPAALLIGLSAGLFEEGTRYIFYLFWLRQARSTDKALMFGAGHGGAEAILFGLLALLALFQALAYRQADLSSIFAAPQLQLAQAQLQAYWLLPWHMALLGAVERASAICLHLCLTVVVLQSFLRRNLVWLLLAILWHTLVNAAAFVALQLWGPYVGEGLVALCAIASLGILYALRPRDRAEQPPSLASPTPPSAPSDAPTQPPLTREKLQDSRFVN